MIETTNREAHANNVSLTEQNIFVSFEHQILEFWKTKNIYQKTQKQNAEKPPYWYYDGPPFATGLPHHGHLLASTIKDVIPRYFEMKGHFVPRYFGWDCHGLPIEHEIDKSMGMSTQDAVKKLGHAGYNQACRSIVQRYTSQWESTITRIGRWVDFDSCYKTMDTNFMESVWWAFETLWKKGLIYEGEKVVPFSTVLGTGLSNFEATSNYQQVQSPAIHVLLKLEDEDCYLVIWTTTPWTLPTNLAVGIGPYEYIKVWDKNNQKHLIIAKDCLESMPKHEQLEVVSTLKSEELVGKRYQPLFEYFSAERDNGAFQILQDDYVTTTDGTGLVHLAPAHGEDDYRVCKEVNIPVICALNNNGNFSEKTPDLEGIHFKDANKIIIKKLKEKNQLHHQDVIEHNYPHCPRSDTPLIYKAVPSWYVEVTKIKKDILASNDSINWVPEHIKYGRFGKWLENAKDWAISRNRYWGTPIPVWKNDTTGNIICIGSIEQLEQLSKTKATDLHPEIVNEITFQIDGEQGTYQRVPEVLDCWFESGAMPFAQLHYPFENKELFNELFPAAFIGEGIDQTRGWFYTLTILSTAIFGKSAFKNVIVNGIVMAEDGKKMSKRLKNYTPPNTLLEQYGADALRLYLIQSNLVKAEEQRFSDNGVKEIVRRVLLPWYNAYKFLTTYTKIDDWHPEKNIQYTNILDQWIQSRLQTLTAQINQHMQSYHLNHIVFDTLEFLDDLTNTYIRLNRQRFWAEGLEEDKKQAYQCLYETLMQFSKLMAPFAPFLSEHIHQNFKQMHTQEHLKESIHMENYPEDNKDKTMHELEHAVSIVQQIILLGRQCRNDAKIKIKTPLQTLTIIHSQQGIFEDIKPLTNYLKKELNVKTIQFDHDESRYIDLSAKINAAKLGRTLGKAIPILNKKIQALSFSDIAKFEKEKKINIDGHDLLEDDLLIYRKTLPNSNALSNRFVTIELDLTVTQTLKDEGQARELISNIQNIRKESGFEVNDRVKITIYADTDLMRIAKAHQPHIMDETLCTHFEIEPIEKAKSNHIDIQFDGLNAKLDISKNTH
ncbi:MAG: isoleucine--tRNA ligase [Pseudomonadota bacterium]|nr:isoleucine--tRNA ligase [Pseudomonadota bacterium]